MRPALLALVLCLPPLAQAGSDYILQIERKLDSLGYGPGELDGNFDAQLTSAIKRFQSEHELIPDGRLTRETYAEILKGQPARMLPPPQPSYTLPPPAPAYTTPPPQSANEPTRPPSGACESSDPAAKAPA